MTRDAEVGQDSQDDRRALFERWVADPESVSSRELDQLRSDPEFGPRIEDTEAAIAEFENFASELHLEGWKSEPAPTEPARDELRQHLEQLLEAAPDPATSDPRPASHRFGSLRSPAILVALTAAALVFVARTLWLESSLPQPIAPGSGAPGQGLPDQPDVLGPGQESLGLELLPASATLRWSRPLLPEETLVIRVLAPGTNDPERDPLDVVTVRGAGSWTPTREQLLSWPDPFEVQVLVRDLDNETVAGPETRQVPRPRRVGKLEVPPPNAPQLAALRSELANARAEGEVDFAVCVAVDLAAELTRLGRADLAWQQLDAIRSGSELVEAPAGAVLVEAGCAELCLEEGDASGVTACLETARRRLPTVVAAYGEAEATVLETVLLVIETRARLARGRADLALRSARRGLELVQSRLVDHPRGPERLSAVQRELARASLAARQPDASLEFVDRALAQASPAEVRAELLMIRAMARGLYVGAARPDLERAWADLDEALALPGVSPRLRVSCSVRRAALSWNARDTDGPGAREAESDITAARQALDDLVGQAPGVSIPPGELLMLLALESFAAIETASPQRAAELASGLERAFRPLLRAGSTNEGTAHAPLLDVGRRAALTAWLRVSRVATPGPAGVEQALHDLVRIQGLGSLARSWSVTAPDLEEIRRHLAPTETVTLIHSFGWRESQLFVLTADELTLHDLEVGEEALRRLAQAARDDPSPATLATLRDALLPAAVQARLAGNDRLAVHVVGIDDIGRVPYAAMLADAGIESPLSHLPSVPVGVGLGQRELRRRASVAAAPSIAVLGGPARSSDGFALSADALRDFTPGPRALARDLLGAAATADALQQPEFVGTVALAVIAHGRRDPETGAARILLAGTSELDTETVRALAPAADAQPYLPPLVVAYVCGAGRQRILRGEDGVQGLSGALLQAGARAVLVASDDVEFLAARRFARDFGTALQDGETIAMAARLGLRAVDPQLEVASARLGGLRVLGLGHTRLFETPRRDGLTVDLALSLAAGLAAGLLFAAISLARRRSGSAAARAAAAGSGRPAPVE